MGRAEGGLSPMRTDLLSLSEEDLVLLSNKGTLKRAQRDLEEVTLLELSQDERKLWAIWSDEITVELDHDQPLGQARCTCPSPQLCRHILRTALIYQRNHAKPPTSTSADEPDARSWSLELTQAELEAQTSASLRRQAKQLLEDGELFELWLDAKPWVMLHVRGHAVRFMVRDDLRYTRCSCEEKAPCIHAVAAVMAANQGSPQLMPSQTGAQRRYLDTTRPDPAARVRADEALERMEQRLSQWFIHGLTSSPKEALDRLGRLAHQLKRAEHQWFALTLEEFIQGCQGYLNHSPHFMASSLVALIGELILRKDARAQTLEGRGDAQLPLPMICGIPEAPSSKAQRAAKTTLIGLGSSAQLGPQSQRIIVHFYDQATGRILSFEHEQRPDEEAAPASWPVPYTQLATSHSVLGRPLKALAQHQLIIGASMHASHGELKLSGADAAAYQQSFKWEELPGPLHQRSFEALAALLSAQAPQALRRHQGIQDVHILSVAQISAARFNEERQEIEATLHDEASAQVRLRHRYESLNSEGSELLLEALLLAQDARNEQVRFVFGPVKREGDELCIWPLGVVLEDALGERALLQPQLDGGSRRSASEGERTRLRAPKRAVSPSAVLLKALGERLGDLLLLGLDRLEPVTLEAMDELIELGVALDGGLLLGPLLHVRAQLQAPELDEPALESLAHQLMTQCAYFRLMQEAL